MANFDLNNSFHELKKHFYWRGDSCPAINAFHCGHCGRHTSSERGLIMYSTTNTEKQIENYGVYICSYCNLPTFLIEEGQIPGLRYGEDVKNLPEMLNKVYTEARDSFSARSYTGVVLLCRKLLMHIAVELSAESNKRFIEYVNYLEEENYITARSRVWVDSIRIQGNSSTHEIEIATKEEAEKMIKFSEMILKTNFEYPSEFEVLDDEA